MNNYINVNLSKYIDKLTCSICLELFQNPKSLQCGHMFCENCLYKININYEIVCPLCRELDKNEIYKMPYNYSVIELVDDIPLEYKNYKKSKMKRSKSEPTLLILNKMLESKKKNKIQLTTDSFSRRLEHEEIDNNDEICATRECCSYQ